MSMSDRLSQTQYQFGGGRSMFNKEAKLLENQLSSATARVLTFLKQKYGNNFVYEKSLPKELIAQKIVENYVPHSNKPKVSPDGGIIYYISDGMKYPILISEAKKQGTSLVGAKGNAIERAYKNFEEFRIFCDDLNYFPYVIFIYGTDFVDGSYINDRLDAMTRYLPRNEEYIFHEKKLATIYVDPNGFSEDETYERLLSVAEKIIHRINDDKR